jgi:addiction module RelE/StbE family toxin
MYIYYTPNFKRQYKKLPGKIKDLAELQEKIFVANPFNPKLETHKLHGRFKDFWSFSIDSKCRIIFEFVKSNEAVFHYVGYHDIYTK